MTRPSIAQAVQSTPRVPAENPAPKRRVRGVAAKKDEIHPSAKSREGRTNISGYFPPEVKASIRLVQAKRGGNVQELLGEALNMLFAKYGVPEAAPSSDQD